MRDEAKLAIDENELQAMRDCIAEQDGDRLANGVLRYAIEKGSLEMVRLLISNISFIYIRDHALHDVALFDRRDLVGEIIQHAAPKVMSDVLSFCAVKPRPEITEMLCDHVGPDDILSALTMAAGAGQAETLDILIARSPRGLLPPHALVAAARSGHLSVVRRLLPITQTIPLEKFTHPTKDAVAIIRAWHDHQELASAAALLTRHTPSAPKGKI